MFDSPTKARLQEIGPRFTLKLRWLRKGLPSVTAPDGRVAHGGDAEAGVDEAELLKQEKDDEDDAMGELGTTQNQSSHPVIPPLDEEQEYEWKWKVSLPPHLHEIVLMHHSQRWRCRGERSFCSCPDVGLYAYTCILTMTWYLYLA